MRIFYRAVILISIVVQIILYPVSAYATAQIPDTVIFKGKTYSLIGKTKGPLATPGQFGMVSVMIHTACYRGYYATYELTEKGLFLRVLTLREKDGNYLPISGVDPTVNKEKHLATYYNLNIPVQFSGKILLAKDFIRERYVHMGYQKPIAFKTVLDITLENGRIVDIKDRSEEMKKKRESFKNGKEGTKKDAKLFTTLVSSYSRDFVIS